MGKVWGLVLALGVLVLPIGTASAQGALPCNTLCHIWFGDPDPAAEPDAAGPEGSIPMGHHRHRHHRHFVYEERPYGDYGFRPYREERRAFGSRRRLARIAGHRHQARMMPPVSTPPAAIAAPAPKAVVVPAAATSPMPAAAAPARPKDVPAAPLD